MLNQIQNTVSKIINLRKGLLVVAVLSMLVSGFVIGGGVRVEAASAIKVGEITKFGLGGDVVFNGKQTLSGDAFYCSNINSSNFCWVGNQISQSGFSVFSECTDEEKKDGTSNYTISCKKTYEAASDKKFKPSPKIGADKTKEDAITIAELLAYIPTVKTTADTTTKPDGTTTKPEVEVKLNFSDDFPQTVVCDTNSDDKGKCPKSTKIDVKCDLKNEALSTVVCKDKDENAFRCTYTAPDMYCNKAGIKVTPTTTLNDITNSKAFQETSGKAPETAKQPGIIEGIFTLIYQIVAAIIMVLLFIIRYLQMMVLLLFISVMTVLLNLSPNTGFLTTLAVPLWSIFAQIASLGAVGILIFLGSATMIGIEGFEYEKTIEKGAKVAIYVFVSNFTYFGLAFAISLLDGFTKLIVFVFGGGSVFKLFEALIASVSSISKINNQKGGYALIPDLKNGAEAIGGVIFGKGAGDITTNLIAEIIVVIGLALIIWVFGRIFFMLLTRVAILLLLLITSPIWVLGILTKDSLPASLKGQVEKAVSLVSGTIVFNFAFITTLVLVTIITQKINGGISDFQKTIADAFVPATNSGLAFIDGVSANAQTSGVLSNDAFLGFGAGGFGETISVCAVLGINLAIIYFAFDAIANLIDTNIQSVGKAVGKTVGDNLKNFRKADNFGQGLAMMGKDAFKYGTMAATGGNELIGDAAGAGLKGVSMGYRGGKRVYNSVGTEEGRTGLKRRMNNFTGSLEDTGNVLKGKDSFGNKLQMLKGTWGSGIEAEKARRVAESKSVEAKLLGTKALEYDDKAKEFDKKSKEELAQAELDKQSILDGTSTDPNAAAKAASYNSAKANMDAAKAALDATTGELSNLQERLTKFRDANGYTASTPTSEMSPDHANIVDKLERKQASLNRNLPNLERQYQASDTRYSGANRVLMDTNGALSRSTQFMIDRDDNQDLAKESRTNRDVALQSSETETGKIKQIQVEKDQRAAKLVSDKKAYTESIPGKYLNDATKISGDIDYLARGGKVNTKFETEKDFQEAAIKEAQDAKKERDEDRKEAKRRHDEAIAMQQKLYEQAEKAAGRNPPPGP